MTITTLPMYKLDCDDEACTHSTIDHDEFMGYADITSLIELANDTDWHMQDGKHYCPCHIAIFCDDCNDERLNVKDFPCGHALCPECATKPEHSEATVE